MGTTSIKRWADSGVLACVKTPGGHRRFPRDNVETFMNGGRPETVESARDTPEYMTDRWLGRLKSGMSTNDIVKALYSELQVHGQWFEVADSMSLVLEEIGRAWARGDLSVIQEHIISERLLRAFARVSEASVLPVEAPTCMLLAAENDEHTLGLSLVELCMRELGWNTTWVGRKTPVHIACEFILINDVGIVAVSASEYSRDAVSLSDQAERLARACQSKNVKLLLGGTGLWPAEPSYGERIYTFSQLHELIKHIPVNTAHDES